VDKPIYNHVTGALDPPENIGSPNVSALQRTGQHPPQQHHPGNCSPAATAMG
jgi:hypothetical protein